MTPELDSTWRERSRPGHTVRVTGLTISYGQTRTYARDSVLIHHLTAHNKRKATTPSQLELSSFLERYDPIEPQEPTPMTTETPAITPDPEYPRITEMSFRYRVEVGSTGYAQVRAGTSLVYCGDITWSPASFHDTEEMAHNAAYALAQHHERVRIVDLGPDHDRDYS